MNTVILVVIAVILAVMAAYFIPLLIELKRTVLSLRKTTEENLNPALEELKLTLRSLRTISDNVGDVTEDVKQLSHSVGDIGKTIGAVNVLVGNIGSSAAVKAISLKAGIRAALEYFIANLLQKGERKCRTRVIVQGRCCYRFSWVESSARGSRFCLRHSQGKRRGRRSGNWLMT